MLEQIYILLCLLKSASQTNQSKTIYLTKLCYICFGAIQPHKNKLIYNFSNRNPYRLILDFRSVVLSKQSNQHQSQIHSRGFPLYLQESLEDSSLPKAPPLLRL